MQYQENYGSQEQWTECNDIPLKITPMWFIDIGDMTVASDPTFKGIKKMLVNWPEGELRRYNPTQEERKEELELNREMKRQTFD